MRIHTGWSIKDDADDKVSKNKTLDFLQEKISCPRLSLGNRVFQVEFSKFQTSVIYTPLASTKIVVVHWTVEEQVLFSSGNTQNFGPLNGSRELSL